MTHPDETFAAAGDPSGTAPGDGSASGRESPLLARDRQWVREARAGNRARLLDLVNAYKRYFLYLCSRFQVHAAEAKEELLQEVFLKLLESLDTLEIRSSFGGLLFGLVRTAVRQRMKHRPGRELTESLTAHGPTPADVANRNEIRQALLQCAGTLRTREARLFEARFFEGIPPSDLAAELGVTLRNLYVMWHRTLARLRRCLEGKGVSIAV